jgi:DNA-binding MarR family transcriptional regulator
MESETFLVLRGSLRKRVLLELSSSTTPTLLAKKLSTDRPSVSRSILFLVKIKLVKCLNPKDKRARLYALTDLGKSVLKDLGEIK